MQNQTISNIEVTEFSSWKGVLTLTAWQGYQSGQRDYASIDSNHLSSGSVVFIVENDNKQQATPTPEQVKAYHYLIDNQERVRDAMLEALLVEYERMKGTYGYEKEEEEKFMPRIYSSLDFKKLIELYGINIHYVQKDGIAYVGYNFRCTWDNEHDLGIMTHRERVVEIGGADTACLWWIADRDSKGGNA